MSYEAGLVGFPNTLLQEAPDAGYEGEGIGELTGKETRHEALELLP